MERNISKSVTDDKDLDIPCALDFVGQWCSRVTPHLVPEQSLVFLEAVIAQEVGNSQNSL